jgi:ABC-type uncharacterized transport system involved in gliding motility auxiliary subunit
VQPVDGIRVTELFKSSGSTWAETTPEIQPQQADPAVDPVGSLGLAALAEITHKGALTIGARSTEVEPGTATASQQTGGRIVVFGDTDFTSDRLLDNGGNLDILQNTIAWMVGEANQVSIRPNPFSRGAFTMRQEEGWIVLLVSLLVVPGIAIGGGIATWLARRRR